MALMGMTNTPTTKSATAKLMMNKLDTFLRFFLFLFLFSGRKEKKKEDCHLEDIGYYFA